jgi:hypothetical protein
MKLAEIKKPTRPVKSSAPTKHVPKLLVKPDKVEPSAEPSNGAMFQAIGIIVGKVTFDDNFKATVAIEENSYSLFWTRRHYESMKALAIEVKKHPDTLIRLIVYPRFTHYPEKDREHVVSFQLVGFNPKQEAKGIANELNDFEFKLSGLWQFIPVCRTPCITILRNWEQERKEKLKAQEDPIKRVNFLKAIHAPLMWRDAVVNPFRFNPRLEKEEQSTRYFVSVKARFDPNRDVFFFQALLGMPTDEPPRYFKVRAEDKAAALEAIRKRINSIKDTVLLKKKGKAITPKKKKPKVK